MIENFGGLLQHFGGQNIGGLIALHSKIARIKIVGGYNFGRSVMNCQICQSFVLYSRYNYASKGLNNIAMIYHISGIVAEQ